MTTSHFDNICNLPLPFDLFAQALHPTLPILTVGLSSGHVHTYRLPLDGSDDEADSSVEPSHPAEPDRLRPILRRSSTSSDGLGSISTIWKTKRHKGSCRTLAYSHDGALCYSAGTDLLLKCFETETGRVVSKILIPQQSPAPTTFDFKFKKGTDGPAVLHQLSPQGLLLGTDDGNLFYLDLRQGGGELSSKPAQIWTPHANCHINALVPLPASEASTSGFPKQWVSVGGPTLAVTDMRKGIVATSEEQDAELTSVAFVSGLKKGGTSVGEKIVVGQDDGVLTLWERGVWGDLDERISIERAEVAVESLCNVPAEWARRKLRMNEQMLAAGLEDGRVRFVRIGGNKVIDEWDVKHDELEGVIGLGFDANVRMVSGGGQVVKVWTEARGLPGGGRLNGAGTKHNLASGDSSDEDEGEEVDSDESEDDSEVEIERSKRKKRKRNKGKDRSGGGKALNFEL